MLASLISTSPRKRGSARSNESLNRSFRGRGDCGAHKLIPMPP